MNLLTQNSKLKKTSKELGKRDEFTDTELEA
jgi:hypothetical protein